MATGDTSGIISRQDPEDMIVSVTRHKKSIEDVAFTCQFPLSKIATISSLYRSGWLLNRAALTELNRIIEARLSVSLTGLSIV